MALLLGLGSAANVLLPNLGMWLVLVLSIPLVTSGQMEGVMLPVLALVALASFEAVTPLPLAAQTLSASLESARRLFDVVEVQPAISNQRLAISGQSSAVGGPSSPSDWQISNLTFTYPGSIHPALQDVSFDLPPGKRLAVVGPSGAGKSTLVSLLLRFWEAPGGSIHLDGRDLAGFPADEARERISVISQRTYLFNDSIRQNLLLAAPDASQEQIEQAARAAQVHDFILGLPNGYATMIGERGLRLSGGERQRLAIARALLKDAPLFLLDEPTANLDPLTERRVLERIFDLSRGRSLLLITHRLVGLEAMDEILVLDRGRVAERGTHAGLLRRPGLYRRLYEIQNRILSDNP
jgi:ABC-type multidrug transport system fused ATPase/permease subunit